MFVNFQFTVLRLFDSRGVIYRVRASGEHKRDERGRASYKTNLTCTINLVINLQLKGIKTKTLRNNYYLTIVSPGGFYLNNLYCINICIYKYYVFVYILLKNIFSLLGSPVLRISYPMV